MFERIQMDPSRSVAMFQCAIDIMEEYPEVESFVEVCIHLSIHIQSNNNELKRRKIIESKNINNNQ